MTIRVAIIGLSASAKTAWASRAHLPYLLSPTGRSKYEVVALVNSSVDAAKAAIAAYDLPSTTRAYSDPADLAADTDVDLVVCNTRVDVHERTIQDSVVAGKAVFCEWPLAENAERAAALVDKARAAGTLDKTVIGLQGRVNPLVYKLRELIESGRIGKVLSSEFRAFGGTNDRDRVPSGLEYFLKRDVGGHIYTIGFAHAIDTIQAVLGDIEKTTDTGAPVRGHFQLQRPHVHVSDGSDVKTVTSDVPDLIFVAGTLPESPTTQKGATLHARYRRGQAFPGEPDAVWSINGEKGEIRVVSPGWTAIHIGADTPAITLEVHDYATDKVEPVAYGWEDWEKKLPPPARGIGRLYEAFAEAQDGGKRKSYGTFADALARHEQLDALIADWKA